MAGKKKIHTCEYNGFKQMHFWIHPERKKRLQTYCKLNNTNMSELLNRHINKLIAEVPVEQTEGAGN